MEAVPLRRPGALHARNEPRGEESWPLRQPQPPELAVPPPCFSQHHNRRHGRHARLPGMPRRKRNCGYTRAAAAFTAGCRVLSVRVGVETAPGGGGTGGGLGGGGRKGSAARGGAGGVERAACEVGALSACNQARPFPEGLPLWDPPLGPGSPCHAARQRGGPSNTPTQPTSPLRPAFAIKT